MRLLVDTDAFCKLGAADLLSDAASQFGVGLEACERLPALPHMLRRGRLRKRLGEAHADHLLALSERLPVLSGAESAWLEQLVGIPDIDPGELQLFAAVASGGRMLVSGDKRALRAVSAVPGLVPALSGRIVVVEAVLIALCQSRGIEVVRQRLQPAMVLDGSLRLCFSSPDPMVGLRSFFEGLIAEVAPLVLWVPPGGGAE